MLLPVLGGWGFLKPASGGRSAAPSPSWRRACARKWAVGHGCAGFVKKPIATEALREEIRRCLGAEPERRP